MLLPDAQIQSLLKESGLIDEKTMASLLSFASNARIPLQEAAIEKDAITDDALGLLVANYLKFPFVSLSKVSIPEEIYHIVPERLARKYKVIAFAKDADGIKLAMADTSNAQIQEMIAKKTQLKVTPYMTTERSIENTLQAYMKNLSCYCLIFL